MSDAEPTGGTNQLGVVDPLRVPGLERARRFWRELPMLGRLFVVAAAVDFVARLIGLAGLHSYIDLAVPLAIVTSFLPHYALLVFPVVVLARNPDAGAATPLLLWGSVGIALVELLGAPLGLWLSPAAGDITAWTLVQLGIAVARGGAYFALASGLRAVDRSIPSPTVAGLANLVGGLITVTAIVSILVLLLGPQPDVGVPEWNGSFLLVGIAGHLSLLAFANLARAAIRGATDATRPRAATTLAAGAMVVSGTDALFTLAFGALVLLQSAFAISAPVVSGGFALGFLGSELVLALLVVAFGLGLGDTSVRIPGTSSMQSRESQA